jgi:hypothetical protein
MSQEATESLIQVVALAFALCACMALRARLKNASSRLLLLLTVVGCAYFLFASFAFEPLQQFAEQHAPSLGNALAWSRSPLVPSVLFLLWALAFLLMARGLQERSQGSR